MEDRKCNVCEVSLEGLEDVHPIARYCSSECRREQNRVKAAERFARDKEHHNAIQRKSRTKCYAADPDYYKKRDASNKVHKNDLELILDAIFKETK